MIKFQVIFIGISGNMLVIMVIIKNKILRSTSNYFLISLSIADLMVASFVMPICLLNQILGYFPWGYFLCDVWVNKIYIVKNKHDRFVRLLKIKFA